jgi:hypothetical protein
MKLFAFLLSFPILRAVTICFTYTQLVMCVCTCENTFASATRDTFFLGQGCDVIRNQFYSIQISLRCVLVCDLLIDYDDQACNFVPLVFSEGVGSVGSEEY